MACVADIQQQFRGELTHFCTRMVYSQSTAEEIIQDVFTALCTASLDSLHPVRGWLYRVARNRCLDVLRKTRPEERLSAFHSSRIGPHAYPLIDPATTPAGKAVKVERSERVRSALAELDDDLRCIIILRFWQGITREELGDILHLSRSGVDHRLNRAVRTLAVRLAPLNSSALSSITP